MDHICGFELCHITMHYKKQAEVPSLPDTRISIMISKAAHADREAKIKAVCHALESAVDALSDYQRVDMYDEDLENAKEILGVK